MAFVAVNVLLSKPLRFFRQSIVQFPHFRNLRFYASSPQVFFRTSASTQIVVAIHFQTAQQAVIVLRYPDGFQLIFRYSSEVVKVEVCQLVLDECLQTLILPALQKLSVQIPLYTVIHQIHVHLDGNFFVCDRSIGDSYLLQIAEISIAVIFLLAKLVDQFFCLLQKGLILGESLGQLVDLLYT